MYILKLPNGGGVMKTPLIIRQLSASGNVISDSSMIQIGAIEINMHSSFLDNRAKQHKRRHSNKVNWR
jgi:hypothetical protein